MNPVMFGYPKAPGWRGGLELHGRVLNDPLTRSSMPIGFPLILTRYDCMKVANLNPRKFPLRFCPSTSVIDLLDNHLKFSNWMNENGMGGFIPQVYHDDLEFPLILKETRSTDSGNGVHLIHDRDELGYWEMRVGEAGFGWVLQKGVKGRVEYGLHGLAVKGVHLAHACLKLELPSDLHIRSGGQDGELVEIDTSPVDQVLRLLDFTGFYSASLKIDQGMKIFEINPRIGTSLIAYLPDQFKSMIDHVRSFGGF